MFGVELVDVLCDLVHASPPGLHGTHRIGLFFMGIGQLGPIMAKLISESRAWQTASFAVLQGICRQQPGPYHDLMSRVSTYVEPTGADIDFVLSRFMTAYPSASELANMLFLVAGRTPAYQHNAECLAQLDAEEHRCRSQDTHLGKVNSDLLNLLKSSPLEKLLKLKKGMKSMVGLNVVCCVLYPTFVICTLLFFAAVHLVLLRYILYCFLSTCVQMCVCVLS